MSVSPQTRNAFHLLHEYCTDTFSTSSDTKVDSSWISIYKIARKPSVLPSSNNKTHDCSTCSWRQHDWPRSFAQDPEAGGVISQGFLESLVLRKRGFRKDSLGIISVNKLRAEIRGVHFEIVCIALRISTREDPDVRV